MGIALNLNAKVTLLTLLVLPVLLWLGTWQLQRADEKRDIAAQLAARQQQPPVAIEELPPEGELAFRRVQLRGAFDQAHNLLLDNSVRDGQVGYEVLTPFRDTGGSWVLVNRGWLAAGRTREDLPAIPAPPTGAQQALTITGRVYVRPGEAILLEEQHFSAQPDWPVVIQAVEMEKIDALLQREFFPHPVRIEAGEPGALLARWQAVNMQPEQHTAYAVQWFALAAALVVWFIFANTNLWQWLRAQRDNDADE